MFKNKLRYLSLSVVFLVSFFIFSYLVKKRLFTQLDFDLTVKIQDNIPLYLDTFLSMFSILGSIEVTSVFLFIFLLLQKSVRYFATFIFFFAAHVIEFLGKTLIYHPGPPFLFFRYDLDLLFPSSYVQTGFSYPSGHSLRAVFLALIVIFFLLIKPKHLQTKEIIFSSLIIIFSIIELISRVSLGEHWTTDVIGGILLGLSFGFLSIFIFQLQSKK